LVLVVAAAFGGVVVLRHGDAFPSMNAAASILHARLTPARHALSARQWDFPTSPPILPSVAIHRVAVPRRAPMARRIIMASRRDRGARSNRRDSAPIAASSPAQQAPAPGPGACLSSSDTSIYIPRLGVRAPVYDCDTAANGTLPIAHGTAVTHWYRSATLGGGDGWKNYVIYGHDDIEGNIFQYLPAMRAGDEVYLYRGGRGYVYTVTGSKIVAPTDTAVLYQTPTSTLTMISCYPFDVDSHRIVVRAALTRTGNA